MLVVGKDYPLGLTYVRAKAKQAFLDNAHLTSEKDVFRAVRRGRWQVKEMVAVIQLRKYRQMRHRYGFPRLHRPTLRLRDGYINLYLDVYVCVCVCVCVCLCNCPARMFCTFRRYGDAATDP